MINIFHVVNGWPDGVGFILFCFILFIAKFNVILEFFHFYYIEAM